MSTVEDRHKEARIDSPVEIKKAKGVNSWRGIVALLIALGIALGVHIAVAKEQPPDETRVYTQFLAGFAGVVLVLSGVQFAWTGLRRWLAHTTPLFAALIVVLTLAELATTKFRWLPMPYFPSPAGILHAMVGDIVWDKDGNPGVLVSSAWHSFLLLAKGYTLGGIIGLVCGVCIGWFGFARYWGMPILKLLGPIPATAWIPVAMIATSWIGVDTANSAVGLIALAVWFPMTMLTASGISNVKSSYLDVARTLGAGRAYLIFRVALPAAMPSIFIGLFMGLSASFLTLVAAESVGVKAGLGYYINWAQTWAEYGKVFGALVIMAVFFSSIMTLLFKVRDRVLVWQKGTIKW